MPRAAALISGTMPTIYASITRAQRLFVGYGAGALAIIDVRAKQRIGDIVLKAHPEGFQLSLSGQIFVNVPKVRDIAVVDRASGKQIGSWPLSAGGNFPMAFDEAAQQVLVVFRSPPKLGIFASQNGKNLAMLETCSDADDIFVDAQQHRVYVACGSGYVDVFEDDRSSYRHSVRIPTAPGARTALFIPELNRLVLAARATSDPASLWVFRTVP